MIMVKCSNCLKKANYYRLKGIELYKGKEKISDYEKSHLRISEINQVDKNEINKYDILITFNNSKKNKIHLREYLDIKLNKRKIGWESCLSCGSSKMINIRKIKYYYSITIKDRYLVAKNRNELIYIFDDLKNRSKEVDLYWYSEDFPKTFWKNRDDILKKIEKLLTEDNQQC